MTDLPDEFPHHLVEARRFAETKSDDEQEEHTADDALSFLLQFSNYPASRMNEEVLRRAVDLFYAPEMTAWEPMPGAIDLLQRLARRRISARRHRQLRQRPHLSTHSSTIPACAPTWMSV